MPPVSHFQRWNLILIPGISFAVFYTGAAMNTARAFGPAVISGFPQPNHWVVRNTCHGYLINSSDNTEIALDYSIGSVPFLALYLVQASMRFSSSMWPSFILLGADFMADTSKATHTGGFLLCRPPLTTMNHPLIPLR